MCVPFSGDESLPPSYTKYLTSRSVKRGESLKLKCDVSGSPQPQIEWYKDGQVHKYTMF